MASCSAIWNTNTILPLVLFCSVVVLLKVYSKGEELHDLIPPSRTCSGRKLGSWSDFWSSAFAQGAWVLHPLVACKWLDQWWLQGPAMSLWSRSPIVELVWHIIVLPVSSDHQSHSGCNISLHVESHREASFDLLGSSFVDVVVCLGIHFSILFFPSYNVIREILSWHYLNRAVGCRWTWEDYCIQFHSACGLPEEP